MHVCFLTRKESVGARQAGLIRGISPGQSPLAAAALLHGHEGGVVDSREIRTTPRGVTLTAHTRTWEQGNRQTTEKIYVIYV